HAGMERTHLIPEPFHRRDYSDNDERRKASRAGGRVVQPFSHCAARKRVVTGVLWDQCGNENRLYTLPLLAVGNLPLLAPTAHPDHGQSRDDWNTKEDSCTRQTAPFCSLNVASCGKF